MSLSYVTQCFSTIKFEIFSDPILLRFQDHRHYLYSERIASEIFGVIAGFAIVCWYERHLGYILYNCKEKLMTVPA